MANPTDLIDYEKPMTADEWESLHILCLNACNDERLKPTPDIGMANIYARLANKCTARANAYRQGRVIP